MTTATPDEDRPAGPGERPPGRPDTRATLVLCRGCCCGSVAERPRIDHEAQRQRLEHHARERPDVVRLKVSDCLGPCEQANVLVVCPSPVGRRAGGQPTWFGLVDSVAVDSVHQWLEAGGPGRATLPPVLELQRIERPRTTPSDQ